MSVPETSNVDQPATANELRAALRCVTYLSDQPAEAISALAAAAVLRSFPAGAMLFLQGDPSAGLHLVRRGVVRLTLNSEEGREYIVRLFEAGETFNEVPAMDGGPNPVTAIAHSDAEVWCVSVDRLRSVAERHPGIAWALAGQSARHTRYLLGLVEDLAMRTVRGRLAGLLLAQADRHDSATVPRMLTQEDMASQLGTVREMVGRVLRSMAAERMIAFDRHSIVILDAERLAEEARR
jgi:CRP/FNR family transcriptional regulator